MYKGSLKKANCRPKNWNEYRTAWAKAERREILTNHPLHLDIELTSQCNLKCQMCWQNGLLQEKKQGMMKEAIFKKVINEGIPLGLSAIKLQSRGESTLHPKLPLLAEYAKNAGVKDVQLTTNGTVLTKKDKLKQLVTCGIDKLIFSVDSEHNKSAQEIYGKNVPDVKKSVFDVLKIRGDLGQKTPVVRVQSIPDSNQSKQDKLSELQAMYPNANEYMVNDLFDADTSESFSQDLSLRYEMFPCSYLWTRVVVFWNGEVGLCCRDYNNIQKLGNVKHTSIEKIWQGEKMRQLRKSHLDGHRNKVAVCKNCERDIREKTNIKENPFIYVQKEPV